MKCKEVEMDDEVSHCGTCERCKREGILMKHYAIRLGKKWHGKFLCEKCRDKSEVGR